MNDNFTFLIITFFNYSVNRFYIFYKVLYLMISKMDKLRLLQNGINYVYKTFISNNEYEKQILEPLSTIIKLAMLKYKLGGTKLSIHYNKIYFCESNFYQGVSRRIYGDKRDDLHNLHEPLIKFLEWYGNENSRLNYLLEEALGGLNKLRDSYVLHNNGKKIEVSHLVIHTIDLYRNTLKKFIESGDIDHGSLILHHHEGLKKKFMAIWKDEHINVVHSLIKCISNGGTVDESMMALETFMESKDNEVFCLVRQNSMFIESE